MEEAHKEAANILVSTKAQVKEKIDLAMQEIDETILSKLQEFEKRLSELNRNLKMIFEKLLWN